MILALAWTALAVWVGFFVADCAAKPEHWQCHCPTRVFLIIYPGHHLRTWGMVATATALTVSWLLFAGSGHGIAGYMPLLVVMEWASVWFHTKNTRKKLADKVLGVVRVTAAGLKIQPIGGTA